MDWEPMKYRIIFLIYVTWAADFQKKNKMFIYLLKWKIIKKQGCRAVFRTLPNICIGRFCKNTTAKSFIIDVWYNCKHTTEVVQDSKINLKWMNTKMLEKTVHFFNVDFAEDVSTQGYPKISEVAVRTCTTT